MAQSLVGKACLSVLQALLAGPVVLTVFWIVYAGTEKWRVDRFWQHFPPSFGCHDDQLIDLCEARQLLYFWLTPAIAVIAAVLIAYVKPKYHPHDQHATKAQSRTWAKLLPPKQFWSWWCGGLTYKDAAAVAIWLGINAMWMAFILRRYLSLVPIFSGPSGLPIWVLEIELVAVALGSLMFPNFGKLPCMAEAPMQQLLLSPAACSTICKPLRMTRGPPSLQKNKPSAGAIALPLHYCIILLTPYQTSYALPWTESVISAVHDFPKAIFALNPIIFWYSASVLPCLKRLHRATSAGAVLPRRNQVPPLVGPLHHGKQTPVRPSWNFLSIRCQDMMCFMCMVPGPSLDGEFHQKQPHPAAHTVQFPFCILTSMHSTGNRCTIFCFLTAIFIKSLHGAIKVSR
jgi:hypothetical protein